MTGQLRISQLHSQIFKEWDVDDTSEECHIKYGFWGF